jgi:FkbM family methyltransferase
MSEAKLSKREFLIGALAGGCALQAAHMLAPAAFARAPKAPPPHRQSFAQSGEDVIVSFMFEHLRLTPPTYIDIGAYHPIDGNNTYLFYLQGCRGVLVEPNVDLIPLLTKERPGDTVLNIGIGVDTVKEADYYRMSEPSWNTFSKEQAEHCEKQTNKKVTVREVVKMPLVNINEVIAEHFQGKAPDFLSIDVEGLDLAILKTLDFKRYRPKVICAETLVTGSTEESPEINKFLQAKDYVIRGSSFVNAIFIDNALLRDQPKDD